MLLKDASVGSVGDAVVQLVAEHPLVAGLVALVTVVAVVGLCALIVVRSTQAGARFRWRSGTKEILLERLRPLEFYEDDEAEKDDEDEDQSGSRGGGRLVS